MLLGHFKNTFLSRPHSASTTLERSSGREMDKGYVARNLQPGCPTSECRPAAADSESRAGYDQTKGGVLHGAGTEAG